jgi:hypothetical protein
MKHVNSKHSKNSALQGMVEAAQLHMFIHHPQLSGFFFFFFFGFH